MIIKDTYNIDWIKTKGAELGKKVDIKLLEKVIMALSLLEQLKQCKIDLIFKGGTSLLLMSDRPKRFSIDIDIICRTEKHELEECFNLIISSNKFIRWSEDNDRKHSIDAPVLHYKFYYKSLFNSHFGDEPILLDILRCDNYYSQLQTLAIKHGWLISDGEDIIVDVPAKECILGDKLTAFAPLTTGILYSKKRPVEIIKQLYDIAHLFDEVQNIALVKKTFIDIAKSEIFYRKLTISWTDVLEDTFQACLILSSREAKNEQFSQLQTGISNIANFILQRFTIDDAVVSAGKTAYLTSLLHKDKMEEIQRFKSPKQIENLTIASTTYSKLNKLKKNNPEAFFYWYHALENKKVESQELS